MNNQILLSDMDEYELLTDEELGLLKQNGITTCKQLVEWGRDNLLGDDAPGLPGIELAVLLRAAAGANIFTLEAPGKTAARLLLNEWKASREDLLTEYQSDPDGYKDLFEYYIQCPHQELRENTAVIVQKINHADMIKKHRGNLIKSILISLSVIFLVLIACVAYYWKWQYIRAADAFVGKAVDPFFRATWIIDMQYLAALLAILAVMIILVLLVSYISTMSGEYIRNHYLPDKSEYLAVVEAYDALPESVTRKIKQNNNYWYLLYLIMVAGCVLSYFMSGHVLVTWIISLTIALFIFGLMVLSLRVNVKLFVYMLPQWVEATKQKIIRIFVAGITVSAVTILFVFMVVLPLFYQIGFPEIANWQIERYRQETQAMLTRIDQLQALPEAELESASLRSDWSDYGQERIASLQETNRLIEQATFWIDPVLNGIFYGSMLALLGVVFYLFSINFKKGLLNFGIWLFFVIVSQLFPNWLGDRLSISGTSLQGISFLLCVSLFFTILGDIGIIQVKIPQEYRCPHCQEQVDMTDRFCRKCGEILQLPTD